MYFYSINTIANPILANIRLNRGEGTNEPKRQNVQHKTEEYEKYLGPGCYEMPRDFDRGMLDAKGNVIVSKVALHDNKHL